MSSFFALSTIYNYNSSATPHLQLDVGELVHLERETDDWYWGKSLRKDCAGVFPKNYVVIRDCNVNRCDDTVLASAGGGGVAHDIAQTLREWLQQWRKLYITNDERFKFMEVSMRALLELRREAACGALPQDQLRRVARTAVFTMDKGNRALGMELAVRTKGGQLVDPLQISTYQLNCMHDEANTRIDKNMETTPSSQPYLASSARSYTVALRVHNFVCRMADTAELQLALYDANGNKLTEHLLLRWPAPNFNPVQVVFTDLSSEIKREKVYLVCHVVRIGSMDPQNIDHRRSSVAQPLTSISSTGGMRRPFGVACADITRRLANPDPDHHVQLPFYPCEKENMDTLLKKVFVNRDAKDTKHSQGLWVSLQLVEGDLKQIREENPHIVVGNTAIARKMGFPEVILPGDARNDLYVTVISGVFSKGGGKSSERNIELVARVVDKSGRTLPGVISIGAGVPLADEYTSVVYYHDDRPRWQEVFKVCLDIEVFKEAHLVFLCRHRSSNDAKDRTEKYFALSYLRLMQREGTTTPDTQHNLCVYKIDWKRNNSTNVETESSAMCLGLPARRDELPAGAERGLTRGALSLQCRDTLLVRTRLCSTKLTQREEILGVLKWSTHHAEGTLRNALTKLLQVPSEELVKFLQDILDALFNILTQVVEEQPGYSDNSYAVLALDCLLRVISLVADHKYQHFLPVLHVYIDESFCNAMAYENLISVMVWVIMMADSGEAALKRLLICMKCLESLVRFIVRSRQLRSALGDSAADVDFKARFKSLLDALVWLMQRGEHALTCQGSALKFLPAAIPHALAVYPATELCACTVRALSALSAGRLAAGRVAALLHLVRGPLCAVPSARALLLPHLASTIRSLLRDKAEVELCVETMGEVMTLLARDDVGPVEVDTGALARRLLPTLFHSAASMLKERKTDDNTSDDPLLRRIICVLLDMVRQMSDEQYAVVVKGLEAERSGGSRSLISDALHLITELLHRPVFKAHWADMLHMQHSVMLHALRLLSITLRERLSAVDEADTEAISIIHCLWREWFTAAATLATSSVLQLEELSVARKQRVVALYGDIRRSAAVLMSEMWFALGEYKRSFIPCLVGPFLEVSFLKDEEVRNATIPLFFDMMQTEYMHSVAVGESESHLKDLESELIDKLDVLVESGSGDSSWRARFVSLCGALCRVAAGGLNAIAASLVAAAARQLDTLLQYRTAALRSATPHRMHLTTRVLHFYEQIERPHMYIRYVHKLANMHLAAQQWAEAGLSLHLHAKLLLWTHDPLPPRLQHPTTQHNHNTHRELKEYLYLEIADLLNRGRQWELAVDIVKELVSVYEEEFLGYGALAELHGQLAGLYGAMLRTPRCQPYYFRVVYYGRGFPDHLTVPNGFVYRGNEYEQLQQFKERLLDEWPDADVLPKLDPPGEEITQSNGQYIQINAVEPVMSDKLKRLSGKPVADQILTYYKYNNVDKFVFSRPHSKPEEPLEGSTDDLSSQNEFASLWLERTELEISDKLPGILRWFPVIRHRTFWVSPVEAAVEFMRESNRVLKSLVLSAREPDAPLQPLTMRLTGILDAAVQGGIENYEKAFLTAAYEARHPEHADLLAQLRDLIADQVPLLKYGLDVHGARVPSSMEALHAHLLSRFRRIQQHIHQRYGRKMCDFEPETPEVQLRTMRDSLPASDTASTNNRISDISTGNDSATRSKFFSFSVNSAINPLSSRNSSGGVAGYFGTLQSTPKRRDKRRARKSEVGTSVGGSQWYTSTSTPNGHSQPSGIASSHASSTSLDATSPLKELRQELVTERPLRADVERERRLSQRTSLLNSSAPPSNRDSMGTTDSNQDEEEPPPLPEKLSHRSMDLDGDNNNNAEPLPPRQNYDTVWTPRGSFLYTSLALRRNTGVDKPPTPPPKKKNAQNNNTTNNNDI
ncbi:hypothetical protein ACJJTC_003613 [Scirpophaga incertulas]